MIVLIAGTTHTGKTLLAQKLTKRYNIPYFSIDHLKMGLIRSGQTDLTATDDEKLTPYLWNIVKEIIKTAIENNQNLIIEGCYIPFDWKKDFDENYLRKIKYYCLVMTADYIENNFADIRKYENVIEKRKCGGNFDKQNLIQDNENNLRLCKKFGLNHILIENEYDVEIELQFRTADFKN